MIIHVKILGQRRGITKAKRSDGTDGYLRGKVGVPGQPTTVVALDFHGRMDPKYKEWKEEFHR